MVRGEADRQIDEFVRRSRALNGQVIDERAPWNAAAGRDAIRHFASGISDDNPLWTDAAYAAGTSHGRLVAPPAFLASVRYPILHGAALDAPLASLIAGVEYEWERPVLEGESLAAETRQTDVRETERPDGRRLVVILSETIYRTAAGERVATAVGTNVRSPQRGDELLVERPVRRLTSDARRQLERALAEERRTGARRLRPEEFAAGAELPPIVRGPLTIGDLTCWDAAIGPSYRAGRLGWQDLARAPHTAAENPVLGWPVKYSQQHQDPHLSTQRGMPAPFDNGVMRFAWLSPLLTNWMGDDGGLRRLKVRILAPNLYGDVTWYRGTVVRADAVPSGTRVTVRITGTNQLGETTTTGEAEVLLPRTSPADGTARGQARRDPDPPPPPGAASALGRIAEQASTRPDAPAVTCGPRQLTYAELWRLVESIGARLSAAGVRPGARVAVLLDRSAEAVAALLGVLRAGGTYVPLEPADPAARRQRLLQSARPDLVLTDAGLRDTIPDGDARVLVLGADGRLDADIGRLTSRSRADGPAYVMYTSASTGAPKGVAVPHGSVVRYVRALEKAFPVGDADVCLATASFAFSASTRQIFWPLSVGARLLVATEEERRDPAALLRLVEAQRATVWDTVPSVWRRVLSLRPAVLRALRLVLLTGEPLPWSLVRAWRDELGQTARIVNLYSQTETAGSVASYTVPDAALPGQGEGDGAVPLGRALPDARIVLRDEELRPVPSGEVGEICVGGPRLASGYVGVRPEADRFVPDPDDDAQTICRTGDLGRMREDGVLVYAGRIDDRVKVRGQRVELGEVECELARHPSVREAAVVRSEPDAADARLTAFVVADGDTRGAAPTPARLRRHLAARVPPAAVPGRFEIVDELPLTARGKLDRQALRERASARTRADARSERDPSAAVGADEIAQVWAGVLGVADVGLDDEFSDLGGDSLLAVDLCVALERRFGLRVSLAHLYAAPTVRRLAAVLGGSAPSSDHPDLVVTLRTGGAGPALFCLPGGGGHPYELRALADELGGRRVYGFRLPGLDGRSSPVDRVETMSALFIEAMRSIQPAGPYHLFGYSFGGLLAFEMARQLAAAGERVAFLGIGDTLLPGAVRPMSVAGRVLVHLRRLRSLGPHRGATYLRERLRGRIGGPSADRRTASRTAIEGVLEKVWRAKVEARRSYRPEPLSGPLTLFRASPSGWFEFTDIDPHNGWRDLAQVEVFQVGGDHWTMVEPPHVADLGTALRACLERRPGAGRVRRDGVRTPAPRAASSEG